MHCITALTIIATLKYANGFSFFNFHHDVLKKYISNVEYNSSQVSEEWIEQPLDHFSGNNGTWKMRYFQRLDLWKPNGPIYLYIFGESNANSISLMMDNMLPCQLAKETNGALFLLEHRYYGYSRPVNPVTVPSLKYLSSKQALADLAQLIKFLKSAPDFKSSKVVAIGGSYAGNLAAWSRLLYPDLVDAAVSSSAPVLAKKNFYEYLETVNDDYKEYGTPGCLQKIQRMFVRYKEMLESPSGIKKLKQEMNICDGTDMNITENQQLFFDHTSANLLYEAQYGSPRSIKEQCESLDTKTWTRFLPDSKPEDSVSCNNYDFEELISSYKKDKTFAYYWTYQYCTEFGYFQTTTSKKQPFVGIPVEYFVKTCKGMFGEEFDEKRVDDGVARSNALYGGIRPNVTKVVFTHGDMDPWHRLGVLTALSETAPVRVTHGTSHGYILFQSSGEPAALTQDREYVKTLIKKWIA